MPVLPCGPGFPGRRCATVSPECLRSCRLRPPSFTALLSFHAVPAAALGDGLGAFRGVPAGAVDCGVVMKLRVVAVRASRVVRWCHNQSAHPMTDLAPSQSPG